MLVLTRHANQSIMIGHDVVVTVLDVQGGEVRIGIRAPRHIDVHRDEVFAALQKANRQAASPNADALTGLDQMARAAGSRRPPGTQGAQGTDA